MASDHVTDAQLAAWSALADAATPGPWTVEARLRPREDSVHYSVHTVHNQPAHPHSQRFLFFACGSLGQVTWQRWQDRIEALRPGEALEWRPDPEIKADCAFVAGARDAVPALVAEVRRLRAALAAEREACAAIADGVAVDCDDLADDARVDDDEEAQVAWTDTAQALREVAEKIRARGEVPRGV